MLWRYTLIISHSKEFYAPQNIFRVILHVACCARVKWSTVQNSAMCRVWALLVKALMFPDIWCPFLLLATSSPAFTPSTTESTLSSTRCPCSPYSSPSSLSCTESVSSGLTSTEGSLRSSAPLCLMDDVEKLKEKKGNFGTGHLTSCPLVTIWCFDGIYGSGARAFWHVRHRFDQDRVFPQQIVFPHHFS